MGVYGVALAGWSSNSKYPLLGGLRSSAQMISYELALTMSVVGVLLMAGSFNLKKNHRGAGASSGMGTFWLERLAADSGLLFVFFVAAVAETKPRAFRSARSGV